MDLDGSSQRRLTYEFNVASAAVQFKLPLKDSPSGSGSGKC